MVKVRAAFIAVILLAASGPASGSSPPFDAPAYLRFTGSGNDLAVESATDPIAWPAEFTLETWVYATAPSPYGVIAGRAMADRGSDPFYHVMLAFEGPDGLTPGFVQTTGVAGTYRDATAPSPIALRDWVHLAAVRDATTLRLYVDGVQVATRPAAGPAVPMPGVPFALGAAARPDGGPQCCGANVMLRNVKLWNRALGQAEVQASAAANAYAVPPAGLLRFWPLDDGVGGQARSALPGGSPLRLGTASGTSRPVWIESAFLAPIYESSLVAQPSRAPGIGGVYPVRIGAQTHFVTTFTVFPPTVPGTEVPLSMYSPGPGGLVHSSDTRLVGTPLVVHVNDYANLDVNGDGREDLVLSDHGTDTDPFPGGIARLLVQQPDGRMADETSTRLPGPARFHHKIAAGDFTGDGRADIFFCSFSQFSPSQAPALMVNDGTGHFSQAASGHLPADIEAGLLKCLTTRPIDFDGDGDLDLVAALYRPANFNDPQEPRDRLLVNDGSGNFTLAPVAALPARALGPAALTVDMAVADFDADGRDDVVAAVILGYRGKTTLQYLRNRGDGSFEDRSHELPNDWPVNNWVAGLDARDFDGDGRTDLWVRLGTAWGPQPAPADHLLELLVNRGRAWVPMGRRLGLPLRVNGGSHPVDIDGDGDLDLALFRINREIGYAVRVAPIPSILPRLPQALRNGVAEPVRLAPGEVHDRLFFDVPARASEVRFQVASAADIDLYVSRVPFDAEPGIGPAPPLGEAVAQATTASGNEQIVLSGAALAPGRWYVMPRNAGAGTADAQVTATVTAATAAAALAAGHFYNPARSGHGVSYEYVAGQRVLIWYTYLDDGSPIWYYAQGPAPSPDRGSWSADLLRFQWFRGAATSRRVGSVTVTETGKNGANADTLVFSWNLDGIGGSETMERLGGSGCPAGFEGNNGMWYAPSLPGYGYTVTYFPNYEFIPVYLYDLWGNPTWVAGEKGNFTAADSDIPLFQLSGFCPQCDRKAPAYTRVGTLRRRFTGGTLTGLGLDVTLGGWLSGTWAEDRPVSLLTAASSCVVP